jgi:HipA-like C-terminal domain
MIDFDYLDLSNATAVETETRGKKPKVWLALPGNVGETDTWLFKEGRPNTLENIVEVLAEYLAQLLGIPCAHYRLAIWNGKFGVASKNIKSSPTEVLRLGNEVLSAELLDQYPTEATFKNESHTLENIRNALRGVQAPEQMRGLVPENFSAIEVFAGYLMFDAWIANQDRHHENWAVLSDSHDRWLAPSFDHAAALAQNLTDNERKARLITKDRGFSVEKFADNARSGINPGGRIPTNKNLFTHQAFESACSFACPETMEFWKQKLRAIDLNLIANAVQSCPDALLTKVTKDFILRLLIVNRNRLLG